MENTLGYEYRAIRCLRQNLTTEIEGLAMDHGGFRILNIFPREFEPRFDGTRSDVVFAYTIILEAIRKCSFCGNRHKTVKWMPTPWKSKTENDQTPFWMCLKCVENDEAFMRDNP